MSWKSVAREPLIHFLAVGAVLFAIDAWRSPAEPREAAPVASTPAAPVAAVTTAPTARAPIVVDAQQRERSKLAAERRLGRAPTAAEVEAEIESWIDEEVLFREAIARGLERDDPVIHQRIASRMSYVLEQAIIVPEPTEAELRAWFEKHRATWSMPERIDFTHVFVAGTDAAAVARADELEQTLAGGAAPDRLGDVFPGGRRYRGRKLADLAQAFGDGFVDGLGTQPIGTWKRRTSRHGLHLVRVDRAEAGRAATFETARLDVREAWVADRRANEISAAIRRLRESWEIVRQ